MTSKRTLNVGISIPCLLSGGTELQTLSLAKILLSLGHNVYVICYFEYNSIILEEYKKAGINLQLLNLQRNIASYKLFQVLYKVFRKNNPDILHVQYMAPGAIPILAAKLARVKVIFATVHQPFVPTYGISSKLLLKLSCFFSTKFITVSKSAEYSWFGSTSESKGKFPDYTKKHFTIYNAIDNNEVLAIINKAERKATISELGLSDEIPIIGVVSRLRVEKGIDLLIEASKVLNDLKIKHNVLIVGSGPEMTSLNELVIKFNLVNTVKFSGGVSWHKAIELMALMDIVVVPSRFEGFGLTAIEAMCMSKPVVASDNYGLKEIVLHEKTGLLFKTGSSNELANTLTSLVRNPTDWIIYGQQGKQRVKDFFDLSIYRENIKALYNQNW